MKKIMFGLAAAIAMVAAADIESSNIVGYQTKNSVAGLNFIAPNFVSVGANTVRLGDIVLSGENTTGFADNVQILDADGNVEVGYMWTAAGDIFDNACWVDDAQGDASDVVIDRGLALLVSTENDDVTVQDAGEVSEADYTMTTVAGLNSIGNMFAHSIKLGNIKLSGGNESGFADNIQILDADGNVEVGYMWTAAGDIFDYACWVDDAQQDASNVEVPAGLGLLLSTENADVTVTVSAK